MRTNGLIGAIILFLINFEGIEGDESNEGYPGQILKYWDPEPRFDTRRRNKQANNQSINVKGNNRNAYSQPINKNSQQSQQNKNGKKIMEPAIEIENIKHGNNRSYGIQPITENDIKGDDRSNRGQYPINNDEKNRYHRGPPNHRVTNNQKLRYYSGQSTQPMSKKENIRNIRDQLIQGNSPRLYGNNMTYPDRGDLSFRAHGNNKKLKKNTVENDDMLRSTRMTPMALMQQEEDHPEKPSKNKQDGQDSKFLFPDKREVLSPYTVEKLYNKLLAEFPGIFVDSEILDRTVSYNFIYLFRISKDRDDVYLRTRDNKYVEETPEKKIIFIVHALSPMGLGRLFSLTVDTYLRKLLSFYIAHLDKFNIFLIPLGNPDGYKMAAQTFPYWNKNMSPQSECAGVNVDRNFEVAWNSSLEISSCSPNYPGPAPFSEPESAAVKDILHRMSHKIIAYFHVHAGSFDFSTFKGDAVLYPRGYTDAQTDDDKYLDLKGEIDEVIKSANFKVMAVTVDTLYNWYGKVTGTSVDYAATIYGIPYAMELVMQVYDDPFALHINKLLTGDIEEQEIYALTEIWGRVINVIFTNIWNKQNHKEIR